MSEIVRGRDLMVFFEDAAGGYHPLAYGRECALQLTTTRLTRATSETTGKWAQSLLQRRGWTVSASHLLTGETGAVDVEEGLTSGAPVRIRFTTAEGDGAGGRVAGATVPSGKPWTLEGDAIVTALQYAGSMGEAALMEMTLTGTGPLEKTEEA